MTAAGRKPRESETRRGDIPYRLAWRNSAVRAGAHRSRHAGSGGRLRDLASLLDHPDPRRIDLRAIARDPFERVYVRRFEQTSAVPVYALFDVSGSMGFTGGARKLDLAADLAAALSASARRIGDAFGLIACDGAVRPEANVRATRARGGEADMIQRLRTINARGASARGLVEAASLIAGRRKLVFLVSDFHMPLDDIERIFEALGAHDIVPIHLVDSSEIETLPRWGLLALTDLETGRRRLLVMRPSLRDAMRRADETRRAGLRAVASRYGREPFEIRDRIDWDRFGAYLTGGCA